MLRVIRNHRRAAYDARASRVRAALGPADADLRRPRPRPRCCSAARDAWDRALADGERYGYRNAQTTLLAPTGTIGLLMDCDTTGVEPDFALVKFKKLAGGGYFKIANQSIEPALRNLGYSTEERQRDPDLRARHAHARRRAAHQPRLPARTRLHRRRSRQDRGGAAGRLRARLRLQRLGARRGGACSAAGSRRRRRAGPASTCCARSASASARSTRPTSIICGTMTVEGAPHLKTSICRSSTAPTSAARRAPASSTTWVTSR